MNVQCSSSARASEQVDTMGCLSGVVRSFGGAGKNKTEGCRTCKRDDDHPNLLLCEICNDEYHTYCLDPPLDSVPDHDFICKNCAPPPSFGHRDGLNALVAALAPAYTCRFGEIIWAAGGQGFGWWPACIYDPRLTVGGARKLAMKHLGKKHLVYFFACHDAPFTVLNDPKMIAWEDGLLEDYDAGKTARAMGRNKTVLFEQALQAAIAENDKPVEYRLDWNHEDKSLVLPAPAEPRRQPPPPAHHDSPVQPRTSTRKRPRRAQAHASAAHKPKATAFVRRSSRGGKPLASHACANQAEARIVQNALQLSKIEADQRQRAENDKKLKLSNPTLPSLPSTKRRVSTDDLKVVGSSDNCKTKLSPLPSPPDDPKPTEITPAAIKSNEIEEPDNEHFFCKILWKVSQTVVLKNSTTPSTIDDARVIVGFVALPCRKTSTFADVRKVMIRDLDEGSLPPNTKWKFYIPNLGPMSIKQEKMFGPVLDFLLKSTTNLQIGDGSTRNPLKIIIFECD